MEDNRSLVVKKIDNFVFNTKILNIIAIVMAVLFVFSFVFFGVKLEQRDQYYREIYAKMEQNIYNYNISLINNGVSSDGASSQPQQKEIFSSAKEAVCTAFDGLYKSKSFEISASGTSISSAVGQDVEILTGMLINRYDDGSEFQQTIKLETKTNFGQSSAQQYVYKNGKCHENDGSNIKNSSGTLSADFKNNFKEVQTQLKGVPMYLVTKSTVVKENYFTVKRTITGKIECYYASVLLSTYSSVKDYAIGIKEQGGTSLPEFSKIELNCVIDAEGNLVAYSVNEDCKLVKKVVFDITATVNNQIDYIVLSRNKTPKLTIPNVG